MCLLYLGELREFVRELLPLLREAEERGDHSNLGLHSQTASMMKLLHDQPEASRQLLERGMAVWTTHAAEGEALSIRIMTGRVAQVQVDLYEGDGGAAFRRIDRDWRRWMALPFTRVAYARAWMLSLHGVATLA